MDYILFNVLKDIKAKNENLSDENSSESLAIFYCEIKINELKNKIASAEHNAILIRKAIENGLSWSSIIELLKNFDE